MIYLILFLGLILRLLFLNQSLWLDEATTALVSQMPITDFFSKFMPNDFHPPLYYIIVHYWSIIFGTSEIALRIPSVIFGLLTIFTVFLLAKEIKLKWPIVPALFLATSGLHVYYSQEARMYSMVTFLVSYIVYSYLKKSWVQFSVLLPLIFLTDYVSILILPVLFIFTFLNNRKETKLFLKSCIPFFITFIFWLPFLSRQLAAGLALKSSSSAWWNILGPVSFKNVALIPTKFMIGRVSIDNKLIYAITIIIISLIFMYVIGKAKNKLMWWWFGMSLVLGIIISIYVPTLTYFRYLFILPAFYLLLSESTSKFFIGVILIINLVATGRYLFMPKFQREDWRGVSKLIGSEKIVFPASSQKEGLTYYNKGGQIIKKEELVKDDKQIWLSRYVWEIFDTNDSTRKYIEELGYNKISEANLNGILIYKYANRN